MPIDATDVSQILTHLGEQVREDKIRISHHAQEEMVADEVTLDNVAEVILSGQIVENYPTHRRGSCCLINGVMQNNQPLHVVCSTNREILIIITVYVPTLPKWLTPTQRRLKS